MKVLAIFTCYNRRELTRQSMELLGQNKNVTFDYVIVNDGSTDGTDEMLAAMPYEIEFREQLPKTLVGKVAYRVLEEEELKKLSETAQEQ